MTNWYAVYTRPRCEKKVTEGFAKRKWESYCPHSKVTRQWMGKLVQVPLFQSCVFVRVEQNQLQEVKKVDGVINIMYWLGEPAVIRDIEIDMLQRFLSVHTEVHIEKADVDPTEMVTLAETPRMQKEGGLIAIGAVGPRLLLPSMGYRLIGLQPAKQSNYIHQIITAQYDPMTKIG